jgi:predicted helicase
VREREVREFARADSSLITNARCLTEGVDVPGIDCVLFADPKGSTIDIVQAVGRALRPARGKENGYVIVPVLIRDTNVDTLEQSEAFKHVIAVLRSLAANDERIIEEFRAIASGRQPSSKAIVSFDGSEHFAMSIDIEEFVKTLEIRC